MNCFILRARINLVAATKPLLDLDDAVGELTPDHNFFRRWKGGSRVHVRCTCTSSGIRFVNSVSTVGEDERAVRTKTPNPFCGRYRARPTARWTPMPPAGGK